MADRVRTDLVARIDAMRIDAPRWQAAELAEALEDIRRVAAAHGIGPAITVVHALDAALARGERGPQIGGGLAILRDAVGCEANDARTCATFAAACSIRLGG